MVPDAFLKAEEHIVAFYKCLEQFPPSREASIARTNAQQALLWASLHFLNQNEVK